MSLRPPSSDVNDTIDYVLGYMYQSYTKWCTTYMEGPGTVAGTFLLDSLIMDHQIKSNILRCSYLAAKEDDYYSS